MPSQQVACPQPAEIEHAKARGTWTDPALGRTRFDDWLASWWATTTNLRPTTRARDELVLRLYARPRFGNLPLTAITQLDVRTWAAELSGRGLTPATVTKTYQVFGKVMGAAVDAGYLAQTPCRNVLLPKVEREEMRFLAPVEIIALADAIRPLYRTLVLVGAYGGRRIGELAGLRRGRVDLLRGTVTVAEIVLPATDSGAEPTRPTTPPPCAQHFPPTCEEASRGRSLPTMALRGMAGALPRAGRVLRALTP